MAIRTLIVEDEPLARQALRDLLGEVDWIELLDEAADGRSAVRLIDALEPELLFLDVHLPELSGLEVLEHARHRPAVVFTTAYDRYAVSAFELEAIDYLVKPFGRRRLLATLERVRRRLADRPAELPSDGDRARAALGERRLERLYARTRDRIVPIAVVRVARIEGAGDYSAVWADGRRHLLATRLHELEARLDPGRFLRIHRSHIVNLAHVAEVRRHDERRLLVVLRDGTELIASRSGSARLRRAVRSVG